jgi:hypothetical protein
MARGKAGRKRFSELWKQRQEEIAFQERQYKAAVSIQCMYRSKDARDKMNALKLEENKRKSMYEKDSDAFVALKEQQKKAALQADKAQAIARETKHSADKEVEQLRKELEQVAILSEQDKQLREEVSQMRAELEMVRAQLDASRVEAERAKARLASVEEENKKLKEHMNSGVFVAGTAYTSTQYDEHSDLKQLDERLHGIAARGRQSKKDLEALVASLAILR